MNLICRGESQPFLPWRRNMASRWDNHRIGIRTFTAVLLRVGLRVGLSLRDRRVKVDRRGAGGGGKVGWGGGGGRKRKGGRGGGGGGGEGRGEVTRSKNWETILR